MLTNTCRLWMLCQRSKRLLQAAKWGHKAVAITQTMGMSSPLHGYKAAKKAGILS